MGRERKNAWDDFARTLYEVVFAESSVFLDDARAAWPKIRNLAKRIARPGCRIRVREASGQTVILIGALAALYYPQFEAELAE